jgi:hypothetical protein
MHVTKAKNQKGYNALVFVMRPRSVSGRNANFVCVVTLHSIRGRLLQNYLHWILVDLNQFNFEYQCGIRRYLISGSPFTIGDVVGQVDHPFVAFMHQL